MARSTAAARRARAVAPRDRRYDIISQLIDGIVSLGRWGMVCATAIAVVYFVRDVFVAYAGQSTLANVALSFVTDMRFEAITSFAFGAGGILYGLRQRQLRQQNIERLTHRPQQLEKLIDANRTSSGLTPRGTTRLGDR